MIRARIPAAVLFGLLGSLAITFAITLQPVRAIDWCHDYTQNQITGSDSKGVKPKDLRRALDAGGFTPFSVENIPDGQVDSRLRPGDVLIFGEGHSGIVGPDGKIQHYVQVQEQKDGKGLRTLVPVNPDFVENEDTFNRNTYEEIMNITKISDGAPVSPYRDGEVQLWRPPADFGEAHRQRIRDKLSRRIRASNPSDYTARDTARNQARQTGKDAARTAVRTGVKPRPHVHARRAGCCGGRRP